MTLNFKNNTAFFEEVNIQDILNSYSTPCYLYSQKKITDTYNYLKTNLKSEIFYAVKANSNQAILKLIKSCGAGADVVSLGELQRSLAVGFDPNMIIYEGVGKSKEDIEYAINKNIRLINTESIEEIFLIDKVGNSINKKINIGIRLNPDIDGNTIEKISTGKKSDKFGIGVEKLNEIIEIIKSLNNINLKSISCHIGSQIYDIVIFSKVFTLMKEAAKLCISKGMQIKYVDLGGGLPIDYRRNQKTLDIIKLGELVTKKFKESPFDISFEPGRYLVAQAGTIITKILTCKENGEIKYLITDAGMQTLIRPAMYGSYHHIEPLNDLNKEKIKYTIAGPICESSDIISKEIVLPKQKSNNFLAINDAGAYGAVMASNYNSRGMPNEILVKDNKFTLIHAREEISEIIKRDLIHNRL